MDSKLLSIATHRCTHQVLHLHLHLNNRIQVMADTETNFLNRAMVQTMVRQLLDLHHHPQALDMAIHQYQQVQGSLLLVIQDLDTISKVVINTFLAVVLVQWVTRVMINLPELTLAMDLHQLNERNILYEPTK